MKLKPSQTTTSRAPKGLRARPRPHSSQAICIMQRSDRNEREEAAEGTGASRRRRRGDD